VKTVERLDLDDAFLDELRAAFEELAKDAPKSGRERVAFFKKLAEQRREIVRAIARELEVEELLALPNATLDEISESICAFLFLNYDVSRDHPGDGLNNKKAHCHRWVRESMWKALSTCGFISAEVASAIAAKLLLIDRFPIHMFVSEQGVRLDPDEQFVDLVKGVANAKRLLKNYYLFVMSLMELNCAGQQREAAPVAVFGKEPRLLAERLWKKVKFMKILGCAMHPENFFKAPQGKRKKTITAEELADSGADLERESYVIISTLAMAILRACSMHSIKTVTFFEDVFDGIDAKVVAEARKHRSQRMVEAWQPGGFMRLWWDALSEQEQLDRMQGLRDGARDGFDVWWAALTPQEQLDRMQGVRDGRDAWWAGLSPQEQLDHALRFPNQQPDFVSKYATAEARLEANCARANERYAKVRVAELTCRLPDPPEQEPRECECLLPQINFHRYAPRKLLECSKCCEVAAALLADQRLLPKKSDDAWYPTPKALARAANVVTAGFEPGKSPFPRVYDLECELFTPKATKDRKERLAKSSAGA